MGCGAVPPGEFVAPFVRCGKHLRRVAVNQRGSGPRDKPRGRKYLSAFFFSLPRFALAASQAWSFLVTLCVRLFFLDRKIDRSSMAHKNNKVATPALWEKDTKLIFCDLCICEIDKGNMPTTFFNKKSWDNIVSKFKEVTGREYDRLQLKNKWDQLKKDWKLWSDLKRGSTGLGWDAIKRTIDASEEWWQERLAIFPNAKKFRMAGIEPKLEGKLQMMFGGVVATERFSTAPSQTVFETTPKHVAVELSNDSAEFRSVEPSEIQSTNRTKLPRYASKKQSGPAAMREQLSHLVDSSNDAPHRVQQTSVNNVIGLLEEDAGFTGDRELFYFVVDLFRDSFHRDFFTALSKERRVEYIRYYYNRRQM